jgi:hypothetical protein
VPVISNYASRSHVLRTFALTGFCTVDRLIGLVVPWCSGLTCVPVKDEIAGSNPVGTATHARSSSANWCAAPLTHCGGRRQFTRPDAVRYPHALVGVAGHVQTSLVCHQPADTIDAR